MDHRDEFQNWCDMWDDAQAAGIFPDLPPVQPVSSFGIDDPDADSAAADYYNNLDYEASEVLHERTGYSPNPVYPDSVGKDQDFPTTPWNDNRAIETVAAIKRKLYDIECRLNDQDAGGKRWQEGPVKINDKRVWTQIESLKRRLDVLSDALGLQNEPPQSMWKTRR